MTMKISDKLREWCASNDGKFIDAIACDELRTLAYRIDRETVELPKDADGVLIHVGDLVYLDDGRKACVTEIDIKDDCASIDCWDGSRHVAYHPAGITHNFPDSWKSIADDLDEMADAARSADDSCEMLANLADRIRKLAEKEGKR